MVHSRREQYLGSLKELRTVIFWRDVLCEFLSTTLYLAYDTFVFVNYDEHFQQNATHLGLTVAFTAFILIQTFGPIGGGHLSPCATLTFVCLGQMTILKGAVFLVTQCAAAASGSALVLAMTPPADHDMFSAIKPAPAVGPWRAVAIETLTSLFLYSAGLWMTDPNRKDRLPMAAFPIGLAIGVGIMSTWSSSGGCMNPMVPFGPAVITGDFEHHWVYWVGAYAGCILALVIYFVFTAMGRKQIVHELHTENAVVLEKVVTVSKAFDQQLVSKI